MLQGIRDRATGWIAWVIVILITIPYMLHLARQSTPELSGFIIYLVIVSFILLVGHLNQIKNVKQFDEREHFIYEKASSLSTYVLILYLLAFSFISFCLIGPGHTIPVIWMPVMVLTGYVLAQFVQSITILLECAQEDGDETEGGAA